MHSHDMMNMTQEILHTLPGGFHHDIKYEVKCVFVAALLL
jgi:hypothetical protein